MLGIDLLKFVQGDLACRDRGDDERSAITGIKQASGFSKIAVHRSWSDPEASSNLLVG